MGDHLTSDVFQENDRTKEITLQKKLRPKTLSDALENVFTLEEIKKELHWWKKLENCTSKEADSSKKRSNFNRVCGLCLLDPKDPKLLARFRKVGLRRLKLILVNCSRKEVQSNDVKLLTWSCLNLISFYSSKPQENKCTSLKKSKINQSKALFRTAMYHIFPEKQYELIKYTIRYITLTSQWDSEEFCSFVFQELIATITRPELLLAKIIKQIETSQRDEAIKEAFDISYALSNILEHVYWKKYLFNHLLHSCFNTLLKVYLLCNNPMTSYLQIENARFRIVTKTCIKYFIANIKDNKGVLDEKHYCNDLILHIIQNERKLSSNDFNDYRRSEKKFYALGLVSVLDAMAKCLHDPTINVEDKVEIVEMIAFCAQKHHTKYYRESITPDLLNLLLDNLLSGNKLLALTSHKIFHHLLDRCGNEMNFKDPVYYFKGRCHFTINYDCDAEDINFFKSFGEKFLDGIYHCFLSFSEKYALITCYTTLCIVLVELPDPVITINIIHTLIKVQNYALKNENLSSSVKYQMHGIISSLLSLICLIHDEEVHLLKKYLDEVVRFRTENSPHLLPPLQNKYTVASHHTTEYHDQLYFLEEEVLYALQRCWLSRRVKGSK